MRTIIPRKKSNNSSFFFVNRHDRFPTTREIRDHFGSGGLNRYSEISKKKLRNGISFEANNLKTKHTKNAIKSNCSWNLLKKNSQNCRCLKAEFHPRVFTNVMWNESEVTYR